MSWLMNGLWSLLSLLRLGLTVAIAVGVVYLGSWLIVTFFRRYDASAAVSLSLAILGAMIFLEWTIFGHLLEDYSNLNAPDEASTVQSQNGALIGNYGPGRNFVLAGAWKVQKTSMKHVKLEFDVDNLETSEGKFVKLRVAAVLVPMLRWLHNYLNNWGSDKSDEQVISKLSSLVSAEVRKMPVDQVLDKSGNLAKLVKVAFEEARTNIDKDEGDKLRFEESLGRDLVDFFVVDPQLSPEMRKALNEKEARITEAEGKAAAAKFEAVGEREKLKRRGDGLAYAVKKLIAQGVPAAPAVMAASGQGNMFHASADPNVANALQGLGPAGAQAFATGLGMLGRGGGGRPDKGPRRDRDDRRGGGSPPVNPSSGGLPVAKPSLTSYVPVPLSPAAPTSAPTPAPKPTPAPVASAPAAFKKPPAKKKQRGGSPDTMVPLSEMEEIAPPDPGPDVAQMNLPPVPVKGPPAKPEVKEGEDADAAIADVMNILKDQPKKPPSKEGFDCSEK